jgi:hypothetical protein
MHWGRLVLLKDGFEGESICLLAVKGYGVATLAQNKIFPAK